MVFAAREDGKQGDDPAEANTEFPGGFFADPTSGHEGVEVVVRRSGGGDHIVFGKLSCGSRGVEKRAEDGSPYRMCQRGKACHGVVPAGGEEEVGGASPLVHGFLLAGGDVTREHDGTGVVGSVVSR